MGKIKNRFIKMSLRSSFILYVAIFFAIALLLTIITGNIADNIWKSIEKSYMDINENGSLIFESNNYFGITIIPQGMENTFSKSDKIVYVFFRFLSTAAAPIWFSVCIVIAAFLFYRNKLKKPLEVLNSAADNITENNLNFTISYEKNDEMGKLCSTFEKMRVALQENNLEMWRQMYERKRLNAAFSHDLRTPLTVLKGHTDMLCKYVPTGEMAKEKIAQTANIMSEHVARLESYVSVMTNLQKLEDIEVARQSVETKTFLQKLKNTANMMCGKIELDFTYNCTLDHLEIDEEMVFRVYENILSNAIRYANNRINIECKTEGGYFSLTVFDDGCGFDKSSLQNATNPFYKSKENSCDSHFGIGLNICKILCEKHGGSIKLSNHSDGGGCVIVTFKMQ